jgi:soluble lytic murein transglycosylase-like protein
MLLGIAAFAEGPAVANYAVLNNGFRIRHARHEEIGANTRLYLSSDLKSSYVDVPTASIAAYEQEELPPASVPQIPAATAAPRVQPPDVRMLAADAAERHQIDADFSGAVIRAESNGHPRAVSPKGAQGLMQLMPQTAAKLGVADTFDPAANVDGGTRYLRQLLELYHSDAVRALAAYNAGPERVEQYGGVPPYRETRAYVGRVIRDYNRRKLAQQPPTVAIRPAASSRNGDAAAHVSSKTIHTSDTSR